MLLDLKNYLEAHNPASIGDLATHYSIEPDALRGMLDHWIRKGKVKRLELGCTCKSCSQGGTCGSCCSTSFEIYQWLDGANDGKAASPDRYS
ncbi:FeoC-like transcriptional regulator [Methyloceanibacter methanicus]|uniref:FeoC-like transcriptional regulator n=1 Tax=Methyloceanibacter methanicus TaxID=1774968 RepID=UPI0009F42C9E|nr:FeoC-like transcriptional regulator [Methyloceanibacter methanicus]